MRVKVPKEGIITVFGSIGCGKTTFAARIVKECIKQKRPVFADKLVCNIKGVNHCDIMQLGIYTPPPNSVLIIDEAGIGLNNRAYKTMPQSLIRWLKLCRHFRVTVYVLSQTWDDMDITVRRLSTRLLYLRKLGPWTLCRFVKKKVVVDKETEQIIDGYSFYPFWYKFFQPITINPFGIIFRPPLYKLFDSYSVPDTPLLPVEAPLSWRGGKISDYHIRLASVFGKVKGLFAHEKRSQ